MKPPHPEPPHLEPSAANWFTDAIDAIEQAQQLCDQQQWLDVTRVCQQAIVSLEPATAAAYRLMGWALQAQGDLDEAEICYAKAIAIQPDLPETHARLGSLYAAQTRWTDAIACYQHAIAIDGEFVGAYLKLGEAWRQQGDLSAAALSFHAAFQRQPAIVSAFDHWQLGNTLQQQKQWEAAIAAYRLALTQDSQLLSAWVSLSEILRQQGRTQEAIACLQDAMFLNPNQATLETQLGNLRASQGQVEEAIALHRQAIDRGDWEWGDRGYRFSYDWFTHNLPHWKLLLQPYADQPDLHFLEVGSFEGMATCWLIDRILTHPSARLTTIDPVYPPAFDHNLAHSGSAAKVNKLTGSSHHLLPTLPAESFQVIYIDGCHLAQHVEQDARLAWPLLRSNGLLIFDDYLWHDPQFPDADPRLGIDAFLNSIRDRFDLVHQHYQLVIRKRDFDRSPD